MNLGGGGVCGLQYCVAGIFVVVGGGGGGGGGGSCWLHGLTHGHDPHFIDGLGTEGTSSSFLVEVALNIGKITTSERKKMLISIILRSSV